MIERLYIYNGQSYDPHTNLAIERHLMDTTEPGSCILYLWQNGNTVVIGRNQNAWLECRTSLLKEEGGVLARRLSGGGAVFHDLGNLNFTFIMCKEDYDLDKQLSVIEEACNYAGISVERSGRNDILADGRKFSGNAFYHDAHHSYHHGTLMLDVDKDKLGRYLSPPKAKLEAKGIASVRSRVVNLKELSPSLTVFSMKEYMTRAFSKVYGLPLTPLELSAEDMERVFALKREYESWQFLFGTPLPFTFQCEAQFAWGHIFLQLESKDGLINGVKVYSDSMDHGISVALEGALAGCRFDLFAMQKATDATALDDGVRRDICRMLSEQM